MLIAEPDPDLREEVRVVLFHRGFRKFAQTGSCFEIEAALRQNEVDMLVTDTSLPDGDVCDLMRRVRHHEIGANPFVLAVAMTVNTSPTHVRRIVGAGVDDILVKPIAVSDMSLRVGNLSRGRKPFVVTHDYIGPERRKEARPGEKSATLIHVPNPLTMDPVTLQREVDRISAEINEQKMTSHSVQVGWLAARIEMWYRAPGDVGPLLENLIRLQSAAEDLGRRMRGTRFAHVAELAKALGAIAGRLLSNPGVPAQRDRDLLPKLAMAIGKAFGVGENTVDAAQQIARAVDAYAGR
ncbi:MAG: response regulator [Alphaproteobacteria bacterium]|nr:response regulator [Alphaproteobacteria bacterium]